MEAVTVPCQHTFHACWHRVHRTRMGNFDLTNFGQSQFLAKANFWPIQFWPIRFWPIVGGGVGKGGGPNHPEGWGPEGWGPEGPRRVAKFCAFFSSPATVLFLFSLSFGLFRGNLVVFEAPRRSHVWSSRVVMSPAARSVQWRVVQWRGPEHTPHTTRTNNNTKNGLLGVSAGLFVEHCRAGNVL